MTKLNSKIVNEQLDFLEGSEEAQQHTDRSDFNRFEMLMNTKEYLTAEEHAFCLAWDKEETRDVMTFIGGNNGEYLNLSLYSEHDHEKSGEDDCNV